MLCPSKRSHINPGKPPRLCYLTCARYEYAVHLTDKEWIKPEIRVNECRNHVPKVAPVAGDPSPLVGQGVQSHSMEG